MSTSRRDFLRNAGIGFATAGMALDNLACATAVQKEESASEKLLIDRPGQPDPAPMGYDRLPLDWYQAATRRLKEKVAEKGVDAVLLSTDTNMVYFTGCFRGSGERSTWAFFPVDETDTVYWFAPGIDRELIQSWWCTEIRILLLLSARRGRISQPGSGRQRRSRGPLGLDLERAREKGICG